MARKKSNSKRLLAAQDAHAQFLAKHGIDASRKPRLTGASVQTPDYHRKAAPSPTSDTVPTGGKPRVSYGSGGRVIGQAYNKGPLMVLSSKSELANSKRRDR